MNDEMFDDLVVAVREAGSILRGETVPSRIFVVDNPDVKHIRSQNKLSQRRLSELLGVTTRTLSSWENGHRTPKGPARLLLMVMARHPEVVWDAVKLRQVK